MVAGLSEHRISELLIPTSMTAEGASEFAAAEAIHFAAEAEVYGTTELGYSPEETLPEYHDQENQPTRMFAVHVDGVLAARGRYEREPGDDASTGWLNVDVAPGFRKQGIGTELADWLEDLAVADGLTKVIAYVASAASDGDQLPSPTGFGSLPADNTEVKFLVHRGYRLEQVVRASRLPLPTDVAARLVEATTTTPDYALHFWIDHTPARWLEDMAVLRTTMSTEEPDAGLDSPEDVWTVKRIVDTEARLDGSPRTVLVAAVEHTASGQLIGFTALSVPAEIDRPVSQEDTLVLPEHRGHRLGMLLKVANLDFLQRTRPGHPSVITFNAEENRHMLNVNEAVGFVAIGYEGAWRRDL